MRKHAVGWCTAPPGHRRRLAMFHTRQYIDVVKALDAGDADLPASRYGFGPGDNPVFENMFKQANQTLPLPTLIVVSISKLIRKYCIIFIPIIGNVAEHLVSLQVALKNKMTLSVEITVASSLQVALFVAPVLVFVSLLFGHNLTLTFNQVELVALVAGVMIAALVSADGESNWLEGAELLAVYVILGLAYFGMVVVLGQLFLVISGQASPLVVVLSTLAIAALFNPLRRRVQALIDRRFFRSQYDAGRALERFSQNLRERVDLPVIKNELFEVIAKRSSL
jgi:hypothetical protein